MEKYKILKFFVMAVALMIVTGCETETGVVAEAWVELDQHLLALVIPNQATLTATVKDVTWSSSDNNVASVDQNGKVTAVAEGLAIITVSTKGSNKTATCTVIVTSKLVQVTAITLNPSTRELKVAEKVSLQPAISPGDATFKTLTWSSSNNSVVSVNQDGELTALTLGAATITGTTIDGSNLSVTCEVNVVPTLVTEVKLESTLELKVTEKATLKATVSPNDANVKTLTWSSSDEAVVSVNQEGEVTALVEGTATISATTTDGSNITANCEVTVVAFELVTNGDFKTDDLTTSFFFTSNANPEIIDDGEKGRVMKIASETRLTNDWDLQFWVLLDPPAKKDEKYVFVMDVRSEKDCSFPTQAHYVPQDYTHWDIVGTISAKPEWSTYTRTVTITADHVGAAPAKGSMGSIAFNLGQIESTVYITNVSLKRIE